MVVSDILISPTEKAVYKTIKDHIGFSLEAPGMLVIVPKSRITQVIF